MFKKLMEQRAELMNEMNTLTDGIKAENRAFTDEENKKFAELRAKVEGIDNTLAALEAEEGLKKEPEVRATEEPKTETTEEVEIRAFADIIRNRGAAENINKTDNGAVIPKTIANMIIDKVKDISPLFRDAERFNVKGTLSIPYVDAATDSIAVAYSEDFTDLTAKGAKLLSVNLTDYLAGVLVKIGRSLLNQSDFDLTNFVVNKIATAMAEFVDHEIIIGTEGKATGLSTATNVKTAKAANAIALEDLIELKNAVNGAYQNGAYFVMNANTLTAIEKVLAGTSNFVVNEVIQNGFGASLFGKPVYLSDQVADIATGAKAVYFVNPAQALAVKVNEDSVQPLNEVFAAQHAIGVVAWIDFDAKVQNEQAVAVLQMA